MLATRSESLRSSLSLHDVGTPEQLVEEFQKLQRSRLEDEGRFVDLLGHDLVQSGKVDVHSIVSASQSTLLHSAAWFLRKRAVKALLNLGADANARTLKGFTPLHFVCENLDRPNAREVAQLLIEHGADVYLRTYTDNRSSVDMAASNNAADFIEQLFHRAQGSDLEEHRTQLNADEREVLLNELAVQKEEAKRLFQVLQSMFLGDVDKVSANKVKEMLSKSAARGVQVPLDAPISKNANLLMTAVWWRRQDLVQILLQHGASPNAQNSEGLGPLDYALQQAHKPRGIESLKALLDAGADARQVDTKRYADRAVRALLTKAVRRQSTQVPSVEALLAAKKVYAVDRRGEEHTAELALLRKLQQGKKTAATRELDSLLQQQRQFDSTRRQQQRQQQEELQAMLLRGTAPTLETQRALQALQQQQALAESAQRMQLSSAESAMLRKLRAGKETAAQRRVLTMAHEAERQQQALLQLQQDEMRKQQQQIELLKQRRGALGVRTRDELRNLAQQQAMAEAALLRKLQRRRGEAGETMQLIDQLTRAAAGRDQLLGAQEAAQSKLLLEKLRRGRQTQRGERDSLLFHEPLALVSDFDVSTRSVKWFFDRFTRANERRMSPQQLRRVYLHIMHDLDEDELPDDGSRVSVPPFLSLRVARIVADNSTGHISEDEFPEALRMLHVEFFRYRNAYWSFRSMDLFQELSCRKGISVNADTLRLLFLNFAVSPLFGVHDENDAKKLFQRFRERFAQQVSAADVGTEVPCMLGLMYRNDTNTSQASKQSLCRGYVTWHVLRDALFPSAPLSEDD
ncbi:MAG: hypothetical protein MHM6MM_003532 [Cercozoa sp. M6MM]